VNPKYTIIWCILQVWVILLGGCLTCEELVGVSHRGWWGGYFDL